MTARRWWALGGGFAIGAGTVLGAYFDGARGTAAVLTVLALVFTIVGLIWGARELRAEHRRLEWEMRGIEIILRSEMPKDEQRRHMDMIRPISSTWNDVSYLRELIRLFILEQAMGGLRAPLLLTLSGVVLGSGTSVWSLWL